LQWAKKNNMLLDPLEEYNRTNLFLSYREDLLSDLLVIQRGQAAGYNACVKRFFDKDILASVKHFMVLGKSFGHSNWVKFNSDPGSYFQLPPSLPMGTGLVRDKGSQAGTLLHELSHMFASAQDLDFDWLPAASGAAADPGVAGAGNPTHVPFSSDFPPTIAAHDSYFIELFQDNRASDINQQWIVPYLYANPVLHHST